MDVGEDGTHGGEDVTIADWTISTADLPHYPEG